MPSFEIPDGPTTVALTTQTVKGKLTKIATVTFTVTNKTAQPLACRLKAAPQGDTQAEWFEVQGEKERPFAASETQKISVNVAAPGDLKPGDFKFRLQAMNVNDPGNDYAESAVATLSVTPAAAKKPLVWPYILVAVVLVLIVGGVAALVLHKGGATNTAPTNTATNTGPMVSMPDVTSPPLNLNFYAASSYLAGQGFHNVRAGPLVAPTGAPPGTVIAQDPPKNQEESASAIAHLPVTLTLDPGVTVPNWGTIEDMDRGGGIDAQGHQGAPSADDLGLKVIRIGDQPSTEDTRGDITSIVPGPGSVIAKGATITVHYRN
jgi:hypothetical protein